MGTGDAARGPEACLSPAPAPASSFISSRPRASLRSYLIPGAPQEGAPERRRLRAGEQGWRRGRPIKGRRAGSAQENGLAAELGRSAGTESHAAWAGILRAQVSVNLCFSL